MSYYNRTTLGWATKSTLGIAAVCGMLTLIGIIYQNIDPNNPIWQQMEFSMPDINGISTIQKDGHTYLKTTEGHITHSESCPCKNKPVKAEFDY